MRPGTSFPYYGRVTVRQNKMNSPINPRTISGSVNATPALSQYRKLGRSVVAEHLLVTLARRRARAGAALGGLGGEPRLLLVELRAGVIDHAQRAAEFALQIGAGPAFRVDGFERVQVRAEGFAVACSCSTRFCASVGLALDDDQRAGQFFDHLGAARLRVPPAGG